MLRVTGRCAGTLVLLVLAALLAAPAAAAVAVPSTVSLDPAGDLLVNQVVAPGLAELYKFGPFNGVSQRPMLAYNPNGTLTVSNAHSTGPGFFVVGGPFVTPFLADPSLAVGPTGPHGLANLTVTDGVADWNVAASADPATLQASATLTEGTGFAGDHRVELCLSSDAPTLAGCLLDLDRDGYSNHQELLAGSDPTDPALVPGEGALAERAGAARDFACLRLARTAPGVACPLPEVP